MRNFFCKCVKNITLIYVCLMVVLSYRLVYNEYYAKIHDGLEVSNSDGELVYPVGHIVGIYTECSGVFVIDTCEIETIENEFVNPVEGELRTGDYILEVNGIELDEKEVLIDAVSQSKGDSLELVVKRNNTIIKTSVTPIMGKNGKYMLGAWIKDDLAGVGTITYYTQTGDFAALGHGMGDGVTNELLSVKGGDIYFSEVIGVEKGKKGEPGEVKGVIYYGTTNHIGDVETNCGEGIFGALDKDDIRRYMNECKAYKMGNKEEIEIGKAQIISDVSGERQMYDIEITYVDYLAVNSNKGIHIEVTDPDLLEYTGGIVQGMSGSPIIQNGKLIGAVTHVLINEPAKGYGIFIDEMQTKIK